MKVLPHPLLAELGIFLDDELIKMNSIDFKTIEVISIREFCRDRNPNPNVQDEVSTVSLVVRPS